MVDMSSAEAVGAYLRVIREHKNLTGMQVVIEMLRIAPDLQPPPNPNYISKIENGKIRSPGMRLIAAITNVLGGNPAQVNQLILDEKATKQEGRNMAQQWLALSQAERDEIIRLIQNVSPGAVAAAARSLAAQP